VGPLVAQGAVRVVDDVREEKHGRAIARTRGTRGSSRPRSMRAERHGLISRRARRRRSVCERRACLRRNLASFFANHVQQRWQFERIQYHNRMMFSRSVEPVAVPLSGAGGLPHQHPLCGRYRRHQRVREINESYGHMIRRRDSRRGRQRAAGLASEHEIVGRIGGDVFVFTSPIRYRTISY